MIALFLSFLYAVYVFLMYLLLWKIIMIHEWAITIIILELSEYKNEILGIGSQSQNHFLMMSLVAAYIGTSPAMAIHSIQE